MTDSFGVLTMRLTLTVNIQGFGQWRYEGGAAVGKQQKQERPASKLAPVYDVSPRSGDGQLDIDYEAEEMTHYGVPLTTA